MWGKTFWRAISQSVRYWLNHRCIFILFTRIRNVSCQFYQIMKTLKVRLPTIYISDSTWLNQQPENRVVSVQRLIKRFGSHSGIILELERMIASSKWNSGCVVIVPDIFGWFFVSKSFLEKKDNIYKQGVMNEFFVYYIFLNYFVTHFYYASITFAGGRLTKPYQ